MPETSDSAYDRGHAAGGIEARLAQHDKHFAEINGSILRHAKAQEAMTLEMQKTNAALEQLGVLRDTDNATVVTTAKALKDAETARHARSEQSWTPVARIAVVVSMLIGVVGVVLAIYAHR